MSVGWTPCRPITACPSTTTYATGSTRTGRCVSTCPSSLSTRSSGFRSLPLQQSTGSSSAGVLLIGVGAVFAVLSLASMIFYARIPKTNRVQSTEQVRIGVLVGDVLAGLRIVCSNSAIMARLVFLGLETALEDALVAVVLAELVLHSSIYLDPGDRESSAVGNLWVVTIIAVGKVGAFLAGWYMKNWTPPESRQAGGWRWLFSAVCFASLFMVLLPIAVHVNAAGSRGLARLLPFVGALGFLTFSTAPKIGFQTLLQSLVAEEHAPQVFGFVACLVVTMDGLIILGISAVFQAFCPGNANGGHCPDEDMTGALWLVAALYAAHGVLELIVGPCLVLR